MAAIEDTEPYYIAVGFETHWEKYVDFKVWFYLRANTTIYQMRIEIIMDKGSFD